MGALIGAYYAGGMSAQEIHKLVKELNMLDLPKLIIFFFFFFTFLKNRGFLLKFAIKKFEDLKIPMKISATDYWNKEEYVFESGDIVPAIRASISIPGIFQPCYYINRLFVDGGLLNPVPFDLLQDADFMIAIDVIGNYHSEENKFPGTIDMLVGSYQIMRNVIMRQKSINNNIDIYRTPNLKKFKYLSFHKSKEIINAVKGDVELFKLEIPIRMKKKIEMLKHPDVINC